MNTKTAREFEKLVRQVLKSKLNGANEMLTLNAVATPAISCTMAVTDWTANEINELDQKKKLNKQTNKKTVHNA